MSREPGREVCLLIGRGGAILWSDASHSPVLLPDSRARWEAIWAHRVELEEIAHSHPLGPLGFSAEDETTMAALRSALPQRDPALRFSVVAPRGMIVRGASGDHVLAAEDEPWWAGLLRLASGMRVEPAEPNEIAQPERPELQERDEDEGP